MKDTTSEQNILMYSMRYFTFSETPREETLGFNGIYMVRALA